MDVQVEKVHDEHVKWKQERGWCDLEGRNGRG